MFKSLELVLLLLLVGVVSFFSTKLAAVGTGAGPAAPTPSTPFLNPIVMPVQSGDDRYSRAPRPQRFWDNGPELPVRGALTPLDAIATRGPPEAYQQMGVLTSEDGKALPLYGRRTAPRSDMYNYYTRTDTYNPVALPLYYQKRDCQDGVGCNELFSGDHVRTGATGEKLKVTLYGFDGPRYLP
jgi:hypothetical protein